MKNDVNELTEVWWLIGGMRTKSLSDLGESGSERVLKKTGRSE